MHAILIIAAIVSQSDSLGSPIGDLWSRVPSGATYTGTVCIASDAVGIQLGASCDETIYFTGANGYDLLPAGASKCIGLNGASCEDVVAGDEMLIVRNADSNVTPYTGTDLLIEGSTDAYITLATSAASTIAGILVNDGANNSAGRIYYSEGSPGWYFRAANAEIVAMTATSLNFPTAEIISTSAGDLTLSPAGVVNATTSTCLNADSLELQFGAACGADADITWDGDSLNFNAASDFEFNTNVILKNDLAVLGLGAAGTVDSSIYFDGNDLNVASARAIVWYGATVYTRATDTLDNDDTITCSQAVMRITGNAGAVILSVAPSVADGYVDVQQCVIFGTNDANTVQINDNTNVQLAGGVNFVMGRGDALVLSWNSAASDWYEVSRSDN